MSHLEVISLSHQKMMVSVNYLHLQFKDKLRNFNKEKLLFEESTNFRPIIDNHRAEIMVKKLIYVHHYGEIIDVIFISSYLTKLLTLSK